MNTRTRKGEIRTGFPLFWCRAFGAGLSAALKRERGFPSPLALSPCRLGSWFGFGFPRCATSKQHHEVTSRRRRRPVDRWCCFSFPNRRTHGGSLIWFKREFPVCCEHSQQKRHPKTGCRFLASVIPISKRAAAGFFRRRRRKKPVPCCFAVPHGLRGENLLAFRHYRIIIDAGKVPIYNQ